MGIFKKAAKAVKKTAKKGAKTAGKGAKKVLKKATEEHLVMAGIATKRKAPKRRRAAAPTVDRLLQTRRAGTKKLREHASATFHREHARERLKKIEQRQQPKTQRQKLRTEMGKMVAGGPRKPMPRKSAPMRKKIRGAMKSGATFGRGPKKQLGPPKVGMRTVKGRKGKPVTIKRPGKRIVGPPESHAIGRSPKRRTGRRIA